MSSRLEFSDGGFAFLQGVFPYSQGVVALPGFAIERARFAEPQPIAQGFAFIAAYLERLGRPRTAFCACELRSPKPFTFEGFADFNRGYVEDYVHFEPEGSSKLVAPELLGAHLKSKPPVLLVHGAADQVVPSASLGEAEAALKSHGVPVEAVMRPGLAHGIDPHGLALGQRFLKRVLG